jgi:hypothetical protein
MLARYTHLGVVHIVRPTWFISTHGLHQVGIPLVYIAPSLST